MEPILNERSIEPVEGLSADDRMVALCRTLAALRRLGVGKTLRAIRVAPELPCAPEITIRQWMRFRGADHREERRFLLSALGGSPFVEELHEQAEASRVAQIEVRHEDRLASGLGAALMTGSVAVSLTGTAAFSRTWVPVSVVTVDEAGALAAQDERVFNVWTADSVEDERDHISTLVMSGVSSGEIAWERRAEIFAYLDWSVEAEDQLRAMRGSEMEFRAVINRLVILNRSAASWSGGPFEPPLKFSPDTTTTLQHGRIGIDRVCTLPSGARVQVSLHVKLTNSWRIYFDFRPSTAGDRQEGRVLVGLIGGHPPTR